MREWIVTNGLGGYASLTHSNQNTSKFHGLLISSLKPPIERWIFVKNLYDKIHIKNKIIELNNLKSHFSFNFFPSLIYNFSDITIKKTFFMPHEKNTTIIKYEIKTDKPLTLSHTAIINSKHFYDVTSKNSISFKQYIFENGVYIIPNNINKTLKIILQDSNYVPVERWKEFYYKKDYDRKESFIDYNIIIGDLYKKIKNSCEFFLILTIEDDFYDNPAQLLNNEIKRKKTLLEKSRLTNEFHKLVLSSDNFIVRKDNKKSILAGYHWFGDWGRDALISLPGITLVTKRFEDAKQILLTFSKHCKNGLIPNAFMDRDSNPVYNTVDASLWYIDRVYQYIKYTNDINFLKYIWKTIESIILNYRDGTDFDIHMDFDYLISHGPGLTWMDVKIEDYYPTPRAKKAVEIQALWYNALCIMSNLAKISGNDDIYFELSEKVKENFNLQYDQLYDIIDKKDLSFRSNQIFLVSLDFQMIQDSVQSKIVEEVKNKLLTIFGLRTLSPDDSNYYGSYIGNHNKDMAYHNGTIWPWLLGPFIKAYVKINKNNPSLRKFAFDNFILPMINIFGDNWDGSIYEIFDGDPIFTPRGCITQAWSVGEILRCWIEDIKNIRPKYEYIFSSPEICI